MDLHVNKGATDHFFAMGIGKEKKQSAGRERGRTGAQRERERGGEMGFLGPQRGLLTSFVSIHGMFQDSGQPPPLPLLFVLVWVELRLQTKISL